MIELILLIVPLNAFLIIVSTGYLIYSDAINRGSESAKKWAVGTIIFPPVVLLYLMKRGEIGQRDTSIKQEEQIVGTILVASLLAWIFSLGFSPPDPLTIGYNVLYAYLPGLIIGYIIIGKDGWLYRRNSGV